MRATQVRRAEKPPDQRVTLRAGTELGHSPQSSLSEIELRPLKYEMGWGEVRVREWRAHTAVGLTLKSGLEDPGMVCRPPTTEH